MTEAADHSPSPDGLRPLALLALGRTGADIERLVREVRRKLRREERAMVWADLETALRDGQAAMSDDLRWRASVHEAGHALVYTLTGIAEVKAASIGLHGLGMVATVANGRLPQNETWLMNAMAAILAGGGRRSCCCSAKRLRGLAVRMRAIWRGRRTWRSRRRRGSASPAINRCFTARPPWR